MNPAESDIKVHVFVCTNQKPEGKVCCAKVGGKEVRDELKKRLANHPELGHKVRVNIAGCLDKCTEGVACVIYPQGEWFTHVTTQDLGELESKIVKLASQI